MKSTKLLLLLFAITIFSCNDDNSIPINDNEAQTSTNSFLNNFGETTQARFIGTVVNEQNNPISGVTINIGAAFTITDSNGVFSITEATVYEDFAFVKASKAGFIAGSRALVPTNGINQVKIMLLDMEPTAVITSGQAITVDLPGGTEVDFSGDFETSSGAAYQGDISVSLKHLSPDDDTMQIQMPGALIAEDNEGALVVLETYGMISVELRGENGEELNLATGTTATIKVPVASAITNPPATIPLWYFNEEFGYWQEEGFATLDGGKYIGEVSHFSFWNCDDPFESVQFCVTLVDENNNPVPNILIELQRETTGWNSAASGYTDGNGLVCGLVPSGETLTLSIPGDECPEDDFETLIGPYDSDQNITITYITASALSIFFTAILNDCDGNPITNGYAQLAYGNDTEIIPITDGTLNQTIHVCNLGLEFSIQVIDLANGQSTDVVIGTFTTPVTDLGSQMSCVDLTDTDGDNVLDLFEDINGNNNLDDDDTDEDGTPDYQDVDDDNDGINTADEDYDNDGNPMNDDSDGDQIPDYLDSQDVANFGSEIFANNCDANNAIYDLTEQLESGTYPNMIFTYHENLADAQAGINAIANPTAYLNEFILQGIVASGTNTITNLSGTGTIFLLGVNDSDNDGLADCEEVSGVNYTYTGCNPNGNITDPNNADTDGDGFNDCIEGFIGTDPNDNNSYPSGTSPIAVNDVELLSMQFLNLNVFSNDYDIDGNVYLYQLYFVSPDAGFNNLVVLGEGTWYFTNTSSTVHFSPEAGFTDNPTPVNYVIVDPDGNTSNEATITLY